MTWGRRYLLPALWVHFPHPLPRTFPRSPAGSDTVLGTRLHVWGDRGRYKHRGRLGAPPQPLHRQPENRLLSHRAEPSLGSHCTRHSPPAYRAHPTTPHTGLRPPQRQTHRPTGARARTHTPHTGTPALCVPNWRHSVPRPHSHTRPATAFARAHAFPSSLLPAGASPRAPEPRGRLRARAGHSGGPRAHWLPARLGPAPPGSAPGPAGRM